MSCKLASNLSLIKKANEMFSSCLKIDSKYIINRTAVYSSLPSPEVQVPFPHFRTLENNPIQHTKDHIGKIYVIPQDVKSKIFFSGGITRSLDIQMKTFQEVGLMVRSPAVEIISYLKRINFSNPAVRFVIYGRNGTGKTCSLAHVLHYAYVSKFVLVHIPWVSNWTKRPKEVVDSQYKEGRIDLPVESGIWLQHFKLQNAELMKELKLKTSKSYSWSKREVTEQGSDVMEIVEHGIQRVRHSSDCIGALFKEIKLHAQSGNCKVLVMVDGVNAFWSKTNIKRPDRSLVLAGEVSIVHATKKMLQNDWNNVAVVTSVDVLPFDRDFTIDTNFTPYFLLGKEGFELLDPFIPVATANYTDREFDSIMDYYIDRLWIQSERAKTEDGRKQIRFLSGYNPLEVKTICDPL